MAEPVSLLPSSTTPWETAHELTDAVRWTLIDPWGIARNKDALVADAKWLPLLAWERSVDLWYEDWPELKKRIVIDRWYDYERMKGTPAGVRAFQSLAEAKVTTLTTPPQGVFGVSEWTEDEQASFLGRLDQLRVHRFYPVDLDADGLFAGDSFFTEDFLNSEPAYHGYRKAAFLHKASGEVIDLNVDWQETVTTEGVATHVERVTLPAIPDAGFYADTDYAGEDFFDRDGIAERIIEISNSASYRSDYGRLQFGYVVPANRRANAEPETITIIGPADTAGSFDGADFYSGESYWMPDTGWTQIFDRYYLFTPGIVIESIETGGCYYDDARYAMAPFTAEVTSRKLGSQPEYGADEFFGAGTYLPPELEGYDRMVEAASKSGSARDTILMQPATYRWPRFGDGLPFDGSWPFNEMIEDR